MSSHLDPYVNPTVLDATSPSCARSFQSVKEHLETTTGLFKDKSSISDYFDLSFNFSMRFSVHAICPSVLGLTKLKLRKT